VWCGGGGSERGGVPIHNTNQLLFIKQVLEQTHGMKERLEEHPKWKDIEVLLRILLMLSFENLLYVSQYLPELFHIVLLLFATGPPLVRATVHGLLINIVHSLYTTMVSSQNKLQSLRLLLSELDQQKTRVVFGLGGLSISAFSKPSEKAMSLEAAPVIITLSPFCCLPSPPPLPLSTILMSIRFM